MGGGLGDDSFLNYYSSCSASFFTSCRRSPKKDLIFFIHRFWVLVISTLRYSKRIPFCLSNSSWSSLSTNCRSVRSFLNLEWYYPIVSCKRASDLVSDLKKHWIQGRDHQELIGSTALRSSDKFEHLYYMNHIKLGINNQIVYKSS